MTSGALNGAALDGRYALEDRIGVGGMAEVYRAHDRVLDRYVAVKVMLAQFESDENFAERFRREATAAARIQSSYVVTIYDWGCDAGRCYLVMELLDGLDLRALIRQTGEIGAKRTSEIAMQVCKALSAAHDQGVIHRDINPQNIMVLTSGDIKVMDFGIAKVDEAGLTKTATVLGTARYMSPEQARGETLTPASDLYSLGVVMYECLSGHPPFEGTDAVSVALRQISETPEPLSLVAPWVDAPIQKIVHQLLEKEPTNRFSNANDVFKALEQYLSGHSSPSLVSSRSADWVVGGIDATKTMTVLSEEIEGEPRSGESNAAVSSKTRTTVAAIVACGIIVACAVFAIIQPWEPEYFDEDEVVDTLFGASSEGDSVYDGIFEAYGGLEGLNEEVGTAASDFNSVYLGEYALREETSASVKALCGRIAEASLAVEALDVSSDSDYYYVWRDVCTLYDCLFERATVLDEALSISLRYENPQGRIDEILAPIRRDQDASGNNRYFVKYGQLYPTVMVDGDLRRGEDEADAQRHIENDYVSFDIPKSWVGKVDVFYDGDSIYVRHKSDPSANNALLSICVADSSTINVGGDAVSGKIYWHDNSKGQRVEIWRMNYAYYAYENEKSLKQTGQIYSSIYLPEDVLDDCIRLQTGDVLNFQSISTRIYDEHDTSFLFACDSFFEEEIEPTIEVK